MPIEIVCSTYMHEILIQCAMCGTTIYSKQTKPHMDKYFDIIYIGLKCEIFLYKRTVT